MTAPRQHSMKERLETERPRNAPEAMGSAGHETGSEEPSELGTAGLYAAPVHKEGEEALEAGAHE